MATMSAMPRHTSREGEHGPASPSFKNSLRAPVLSLRLMHGPFPGISSDRLRPIPTKVRLNRLQGHQLKGRFWWFIGVYLQSREGVRMRILPKERKVPAPWRVGNVLPKYS
jgi:hypothetical protein